MGWIEPKIDWSPSLHEGVKGSDFNRIEGNIEFLGQGNPIQDVDGNYYRTAIINGQQWTVDNWACTKYADGTAIPEVTDQTAWEALTTPAYCKYDNNISRYGFLYNWYSWDVSNPLAIAPSGWRVPFFEEVQALAEFLSSTGYTWDKSINTDGLLVAQALASKEGWDSGVASGSPGNEPVNNNESLLAIVPGGIRTTSFSEIGTSGYIAMVDDPPLVRPLRYGLNALAPSASAIESDSLDGVSVRFVRDIN